MSLKIVFISDTHEQHDAFDIPCGDVLVHAGDFTYLGERDAVVRFNKWLGELSHPHKIVICGNHELTFERDFESFAPLITNATLLHNSGCEVEGVKFWGSPVTPIFGKWAFMLDWRDRAVHWSKVPEDIDVLVTHGPPAEMLDRPHPNHQGCGDGQLGVAVDRIKPKVHVFGHIHGGHGIREHKGTTFINAAMVNEQYQPTNKAQIALIAEPGADEGGKEKA